MLSRAFAISLLCALVTVCLVGNVAQAINLACCAPDAQSTCAGVSYDGTTCCCGNPSVGLTWSSAAATATCANAPSPPCSGPASTGKKIFIFMHLQRRIPSIALCACVPWRVRIDSANRDVVFVRSHTALALLPVAVACHCSQFPGDHQPATFIHVCVVLFRSEEHSCSHHTVNREHASHQWHDCACVPSGYHGRSLSNHLW